MHNAPAVSFPVGRSHFQAWIIGFMVFLGGVIGLLWVTQVDESGWRQALFAIAYVATCVLAAVMWQRSAQGILRWDGQAWRWQIEHATICGVLTVHLDLQFFLLVSLRAENGDRFWLWPERQSAKTRWQDLRRAVFSRRRTAKLHDTDPETALWQEPM
jgi:toxin CptA